MAAPARAHWIASQPLSADLRLGDIFRLLDACPALQQVYRRSWAVELCQEARKGPLPQADADDDGEPAEAGGIECAELYWSWSLDTASHTYQSVHSLQLQGLGPVLPADAPGHGLQAGDRIRWSLSLTPVRTLLDLPLRLREELQITEGDIDAQAYADTIQVARCTEVLLGQVIQGVLDELSFHGGPQDQAEFRTELQSRVAAVQDECAETISADDLFADWDRPGYETLFETLGDVPPAQVRRAMRNIADEAPAGPALQQAFGGRVVVKPGFWNRPGRAFRKAFRAAGR